MFPGLNIVEVSGPGIIGSRREVRLRNGAETALNIGYGRLASISGKVVDEKGEPIDSARVSIDGRNDFTKPDGTFYLGAVASARPWPRSTARATEPFARSSISPRRRT